MAGVQLIVLYPYPADPDQFEKDYEEHLRLLHQKSGIPEGEQRYTRTRILPTPDGPPPFYQLFTLPFPSAEALQEAMASPGMQEVAAHATQISTGGPPVIMVGSDAG